jgi:cell division septation protein DedD
MRSLIDQEHLMNSPKSMLHSVRVRIAAGALAVGLTSFFSGAATGFSLRPADAVEAEAAAVAMAVASLTECRAASPSALASLQQDPAETAPESTHDEGRSFAAAASERGWATEAEADAGSESRAEIESDARIEAEAARSSRWLVQVGAFSSDENAHALASRLEQKGYDPLIVAARSRTGEWLQHVRLDFEADEAAVVARAREFEQREGLPVVVVAIGPDGERLR